LAELVVREQKSKDALWRGLSGAAEHLHNASRLLGKRFGPYAMSESDRVDDLSTAYHRAAADLEIAVRELIGRAGAQSAFRSAESDAARELISGILESSAEFALSQEPQTQADGQYTSFPADIRCYQGRQAH
jgi:hypothetical protein